MMSPPRHRKSNAAPDLLVGAALFSVFAWLMAAPSQEKTVTHTDKDRHMAVITAIAETVNEPLEGQLAVMAVMVNRLTNPKYQWKTLTEVVQANGKHKKRRVYQFEPWQTRRAMMLAIKRHPSRCPQGKQFASCVKNAKAYREMSYMLDGFLSGVLQDPTRPFCAKGAWFFLNERVVRRRYNRLPPFTRGKKGLKIGRHTFYCWSKK